MKMKYRFIAFVLLMCVASGIAQECIPPPGYVCIKQEAANDIGKRLTELIEARNVIAKFAEERAAFTNERSAAIAERDAALMIVKRVDQLIAIDDKIMVRYTQFVDKAWEILDLQSKLIEKLIARIDKPKSAWAKFMDALKTIGNIALGIVIGRGL